MNTTKLIIMGMVMLTMLLPADAQEYEWFFYITDTGFPPWMAAPLVTWGVWPGAVDGFDNHDKLDGLIIGFYHETGDEWAGPSGLYRSDFRSSLVTDETKVWSDLYLCYLSALVPEVRTLRFGCSTLEGHTPPLGWTYTLYLDKVQDGIDYTGPTSWTLIPGVISSVFITLPMPPVSDFRHGYRFHFVVEPIPEPSTLLPLAGAAITAAALWRRRWKK